jgi:hypothetical protein
LVLRQLPGAAAAAKAGIVRSMNVDQTGRVAVAADLAADRRARSRRFVEPARVDDLFAVPAAAVEEELPELEEVARPEVVAACDCIASSPAQFLAVVVAGVPCWGTPCCPTPQRATPRAISRSASSPRAITSARLRQCALRFRSSTDRAFFSLDPRLDPVRNDPRFRGWTVP